MPYVEKCGVETIKQQIFQWEGVMNDPNIDGFNGYACKKKLLEVRTVVNAALKNAPTYAGEDDEDLVVTE